MTPADRNRLAELLGQLRSGLAHHPGADFASHRADGTALVIELDGQDLRADPTVAGIVLTVRDVTRRRALERELTHQAFHDSLTGLANRVLFQNRVEYAVTRARRDQDLVGVLFVDLDDFKVLNETLGHALGDELLVAVAARIREVLRPDDTVARLGGDEFAVLIEAAPSMSDLEAVAERIVATLQRPFTVGGETVTGQASVGIGTTADATEAAELLRHADLAMYVAKGDGKGVWRRYRSEVHTEVLQRLQLRAELDQAIKDRQLRVHYQPIVDLSSGAVVGLEALVRWEHPVRGMVPPVQFIGVAEESGLIRQIGAHVLEQALTDLASFQQRLPDTSLQYVSVNVSPRQLGQPGFVDHIRRLLQVTGVPAQALLLEITESLLLGDDERVRDDLGALRAMGVRIAIDDFGTGYSSLSYLRHMPVDVLKIDKSFIDDVVDSAEQRAVVGAVVDLAATLKLRVIAEGVEETAHRDLLRNIGCPLGQGYLFARPLPESEVFALLRSAALVTA